MAKLETVAKSHGFRDFSDYNTVAGNIQIVLDGVDPETKTYVGADKLMQKSIADVKADSKMPASDKQATLTDLQTQLKSVTQVVNKGNIDLVLQELRQAQRGLTASRWPSGSRVGASPASPRAR